MGTQESAHAACALCHESFGCRAWCTAGRSQDIAMEELKGLRSTVPVILHFDVNKTVILSDSISMKGVEDSIREGIAELYWGHVRNRNGKVVWEWTQTSPSLQPPPTITADTEASCGAVGSTCNYRQYCKETVKDSSERKKAIRTFNLVDEHPVKQEMEELCEKALERMQLAADFQNNDAAKAAGVAGHTYNMLPALFHMVATLQVSGRPFAVLFRSFGADHERVKAEWNAFCELRHPIFSDLIKDIGPLDGSQPRIPDRRIHSVHTLYRDDEGPMLILDRFTNGPSEASWDEWAKAKPAPEIDTREGREYVREVLKAKTVDGFQQLQAWMHSHLMSESTAGIKDDWAWWHANGEECIAGKVLPLIGGLRATSQIFFDDNIEINDPRIVDCRDPNGLAIPASKSLSRLCVKVNPIEALFDHDYFLRKLQSSEAASAATFHCSNCLMAMNNCKLKSSKF
mmetsp:Transcript_78094/g.215947  ORF Transcript_78094/g.215947 Transcript_78094/m.215947 type:complete len:458 (-) Transcript_78094:119-1492(-)